MAKELSKVSEETVFKAFTAFKGVNTAERPISIAEDELSMLCNYMPIGDATLRKIYGPSLPKIILDTTATIVKYWIVDLSGSFHFIVFMSDGSLYDVAISTWTATLISAAGTFTAPAVASWKGILALIIDTVSGYWSWDGTTLVHLSGSSMLTTSTASLTIGTGSITFAVGSFAGINLGDTIKIQYDASNFMVGTVTGSATVDIGYPALEYDLTVDVTSVTGSGTYAAWTIYMSGFKGYAIIVFKGRVWIAVAERTVIFSAPDDYNNFTTQSGGGSFLLGSSSLTSRIVGFKAQQDFLYVLGDHAIYIITGVTVSSTAATSFTMTEIVTHLGCTHPETLDIFASALIFDGGTGIYGMSGLFSDQRVSDELDGLVIDYSTFSPMGATFHLFGIECYGYLAKVWNVDSQAWEKWIATFFVRREKRRWFFVRLPFDFTYFAAYESFGQDKVYAAYGQSIVQLFDPLSTTEVEGWIRSRAERFGVPINDKRMEKFGISCTSENELTFKLIIDTDLSYFDSFKFNAGGQAHFVDLAGNPVTWTNDAGEPVGWVAEQTSFFQGVNCEGRGKAIIVDLREKSSNVYSIEALYLEGTVTSSWENHQQ